jgi:hypothetical protein
MTIGAQAQVVTGGSATSAFRPALNTVGGGNISFLAQVGSGIGTAETQIKGTF